MKKILFFSLFFIIAISVMVFLVTLGEAKTVGCGSTNGVSPTKINVGDTVSCTIKGTGTYYYFYLTKRTDVTIDLDSPGMKAKFCIYKGRGAYGSPVVGEESGSRNYSTPTLDAGSWTIMVNPWLTQTMTFTMKVYAQTPAPYCGDGNCDSGESCSSCPLDCGSCALKANGASCTSDSQCKSKNCDNGYCCSTGKCCKSDTDCPSYAYCYLAGYNCRTQGNDGEGCSRARQCKGGYCVHNKCRSKSYHCGDGHCDSAKESSSSCPADCGALKKLCDSCSSNSECSSGRCSLFGGGKYRCSTWAGGSCCSDGTYVEKYQKGVNCCSDGNCSSGYKCVNYKCVKKALKPNGSTCTYVSECQGGYCVHKICRSKSYHCGDGHCDSAKESCSTCSKDCGACPVPKKDNGKYCEKDSDCKSNNCRRYLCCAKGKECCGPLEGHCLSSQYCSDELFYCVSKLADGKTCESSHHCKSNHCQHGVCCKSGEECCKNDDDCYYTRYCENHICLIKKEVGQSCKRKEECQTDNCHPASSKCAEKPTELEATISSNSLALKVGDTHTLILTLKNSGQNNAKEVNYEILVDKPEVVEVSPAQKNLGAIGPSVQPKESIKIKAKKEGTTYLVIHIKGNNFASIRKILRVRVEEAMALSVPEAMFMQPDEVREPNIFLINASSELTKVYFFTVESLNPDVVSLETDKDLRVVGQGDGIKPDRIFTSRSQDITDSIFPQPRFRAKSEGETEIVFKFGYYFPKISEQERSIIEERVKVMVGRPTEGKRAKLDLKIIPHGLAVERDEAREVKIVLANTGSQIIKNGKILINKSSQAPFEATQEVTFGYIGPGRRATAKIDVVGHSQLSAELESQAKRGGELIVTGTLTFKGQYSTVEGGNFTFEDQMKVSLVEERKKCEPHDKECIEAVDCLISLSNTMGCALEFADIIPYLDKPVAVVLATADVCEIKGRAEAGDSIGAAISALLMTVDVGDNAGEAVPGAGNLASTFIDTIEGAADCTEGFIYDAVDKYCAGGTGKGYTGCAEKIFEAIAGESYRWKEPRAAKSSVVAVVASPVTIAVVDDKGKELGVSDGVVVIQKGELKLVFIKNPHELSNGYNFQVTGIADGDYNIHLALIDEGKVVEKTELKDQPIKMDQEVKVPLVVQAQAGKLIELLVGKEAKTLKMKEKLEKLSKFLPIIILIIVAGGLGFLVYKYRKRIFAKRPKIFLKKPKKEEVLAQKEVPVIKKPLTGGDKFSIGLNFVVGVFLLGFITVCLLDWGLPHLIYQWIFLLVSLVVAALLLLSAFSYLRQRRFKFCIVVNFVSGVFLIVLVFVLWKFFQGTVIFSLILFIFFIFGINLLMCGWKGLKRAKHQEPKIEPTKKVLVRKKFIITAIVIFVILLILVLMLL